MHERLLIVEDDAALAAMVAEYLGTAGYAVTRASTGAEGLRQAAAGAFDLVILDVMLPDIDGFDVCRSLRSRSQVPVLMLTARGDPADRIVGLELGADDYLPKPFEPRELLARIRAVMRRGRPGPGASEVLRFGRLEVDRDTRTVHVGGEARFDAISSTERTVSRARPERSTFPMPYAKARATCLTPASRSPEERATCPKAR